MTPPIRLFALLAGLCGLLAAGCSGPMSTGEVSSKDAFIDSVLNTLTLEDKAGEMTQLTLDMVCVKEGKNVDEPHRLDPKKLNRVLVDLRVGSILNCAGHAYTPEKWHGLIGDIQATAAEKPSGIPVLYGIDAIHGTTYTTGGVLGPQQLGLAATWDTLLVRNFAENAAKEVLASGIPWNFSPVLDVARDARWPRFWETFGESPRLVADMGVAMVRVDGMLPLILEEGDAF